MSPERILRYAVRKGVYYDSLVLMGLHAALARREGVLDAGAIMASRTNLELLAASGLLAGPDGDSNVPDAGTPDAGTPDAGIDDLGAEDLLVVVAADSAEAADAALEELDGLLRSTAHEPSETFRPRSLDGALRRMPGADWVAISVPGPYAASIARDALHLDLDVFLYSDNVALDDEVELKRLAAERGRLVLGPDCGTAMLGGVGLGFANRVRQGSIGLVGASGTGLQAVAVAVDRLGGGISRALGTGGRDLSGAVGGATAHRALDRLADDAATDVIVLISKQPEAAVAERLLSHAARIDKPVVVYSQGDAEGRARNDASEGTAPPGPPTGLYRARSLRHAARVAHALALGRRPPADESPSEAAPPEPAEPGGYLRGLFAGGTLAAETLWQLAGRCGPLHSNLAGVGGLEAPWEPLDDVFASRGHTILDLGDDALTRGRLHPMIDPTPQAERLLREAADPEVALILLDVVLGDGAHPDPAARLAPAIRQALEAASAEGRTLAVVALVVGTGNDPQDLADQIEQLTDAGAAVVDSVEGALELALEGTAPDDQLELEVADPSRLIAAGGPTETTRPVSTPAAPKVINIGLETFFDSLEAQGAEAVHVDWRPSAGGNERLAAILERLKANDRRQREATGA